MWNLALHSSYEVQSKYWTSMLWSIDSCQNRVSADQCHMTITGSGVQPVEVMCFLKLSADQILFSMDRRLRSIFHIEFSLLLVYDKSWISSERHFFKDPTTTLLLALAKSIYYYWLWDWPLNMLVLNKHVACTSLLLCSHALLSTGFC